jgi:hypothetical protein
VLQIRIILMQSLEKLLLGTSGRIKTNKDATDHCCESGTFFHFDADPDPAPVQSDANLRPLDYRVQTFLGTF